MEIPVPTEINKTAPGEITVTWDDGHVSVYTMRYLRQECACAGCVSEVTGEKLLDPASVPEDVSITGAEHVGRYGIKFFFSDRHSDGIYTWSRLREICPCAICRTPEGEEG